MGLAILFILLLELTLFNFRYYTTTMSGLKPQTIEITEKNLASQRVMEPRGSENMPSNAPHISITEKVYTVSLNQPVNGIRLNLSSESENSEITVSPNMTDESSKYKKKELEEKTCSPKYHNSEYIAFTPQGKCIDLELKMTSDGDFNLDSIEINTWYFSFNWIRVCTLLFIAILLICRKPVNHFFEIHPAGRKAVYAGLIAAITVLIACYSSGFGRFYEHANWEKGMVLKDIYRELTKSVMNGQTALDFDEASKAELSKLENPQDASERQAKQTQYLFDAAFYDGNYYCYYGAIPVFSVLVPLALITGTAFYSNVICIVYATLVNVMMLAIYLKLLKKFRVQLEFLSELTGYLCLLFTMELFQLWLNPNFYQAVDLCGIFWSLLAFWQILKLEDGLHTKKRLFVIGLSYGCMVLTRPTYIFYIVPILFAIWRYLFKNKKPAAADCIAFTLPIIMMAALQMGYNYARFGTVLEFGQFHQITINDTSTLKAEPGIAIDGLLSFFINPPAFMRHFPFVGYNDAGVNSGNAIFTSWILGIFWHPFLLILLTARNRARNNPGHKRLAMYTVMFWLIIVAILVITICYAGVLQRYMTFILPTLTLMAFHYWLLYINESENGAVKKDRIRIYKTVCLTTLILMLLFAFTQIGLWVPNTRARRFVDTKVVEYNIRHSFEFYK